MVNRRVTPYLYVAPSLFIVALFIYYPIFENLLSSFYSWTPFSTTKDFIGFGNYTRLFQDSIFQLALKNNIIHAIISFTLQVFGGLVLAAILEDKIFRKVSPILRTVYFFPVLISISVIGLLFSFIYSPDIGLLNKVLTLLGLGEYTTGWLGNSSTSMYAVIAMGQWQGIGYAAMLYIVAIQKIPNELYESAKMDGCNKIQTFLHITFPQVKEMVFVVSLTTLSQSILVFSDVYVLTNGGPGDASQVLSTYLYSKAFVDNEMGYASTIANVILALTLILYIVQVKIFKKDKEA
jgi:raffinose/stachyose/melibiose transport system permease protein